MLKINRELTISESEVEISAIRAQGSGGQNINKVSTAIHLRFNIAQSSLPYEYKRKLLHTRDYRITNNGIIVIKAQRYRSQEKNKEDALERLTKFIQKVNVLVKNRKQTKPSKSSIKTRLDQKTKRGQLKKLRRYRENKNSC